MKLDIMVSSAPWQDIASLAKDVEHAGFSGMVFTETSHIPWMSIAAAVQATDRLEFATGIAVAFARSPMVSAVAAWELAENSRGRFRLGLGSQVRAHIERRYGMAFEPPGPRLRDYVNAVKACFEAFRGESELNYAGEYYQLTLLPKEWTPKNHPYGDVKVDVAAVNPWMVRMATTVADGIAVHPLHSSVYFQKHFMPTVNGALDESGKSRKDIEISVPVFVVPGDSYAERRDLLEKAREQIAFYGSTKNYAFQFDDLGFNGLSSILNQKLKAGDRRELAAVVSDEILSNFAVIGKWADIPDLLIEKYSNVADRLVMYQAEETITSDRNTLAKWSEVAKKVTSE